MKRNLAIAAGAVALAIPAVAFGAGANTVYVGSLVGSPDSAVKLKQAKGEQGRVVKPDSVQLAVNVCL